MPIVEKSDNRPFGQREYQTELFKPTFEGYHFKFTLLLPIYEYKIGQESSSKEVFRSKELDMLEKLFLRDFDGVTYSRDAKHPILEGVWKNIRTDENTVNRHALYEIYSQRHDKVIEYFKELKTRLHTYAEKELNMKQDVIVIEQTEVTFISNFSPSSEK